MTKALLFSFFIITSVQAYVPTVESLFRQGSNPEVVSNGVSVSMVVRKIIPGEKTEGTSVSDVSLLADDKAEDFYKFFITKSSGDALKIAQARYTDKTFSDKVVRHKIYYPNFTPYTVKTNIEQIEKGLFMGLLHSMTLNNGSHLINYLKSLGAPVKLNGDLINRSKLELLADYKAYLTLISKDRSARATAPNPLKPEDQAAKVRVDQLMKESMYVDLEQVKLGRDEGEMAWLVVAGPFEAVISYKDREVKRLRYKSAAGEMEILCEDYWLANGTHRMPKSLILRNFSGVTYQIEITNLRHYVENGEDIVKRLKNWDENLKGKDTRDPRPEFLF
ncbi:MAG TPA: hypothetical protein VNJ01_14415 [Bacteriovoracaceae bacterium]|nr:hypothetical protein [Bacteriovoracaceae bacterium]